VDDILTAWKKAYGKDRIAKWIEDLEKAKTVV
jgi:predicted HAD superfamily phosphohydrolase YqeG